MAPEKSANTHFTEAHMDRRLKIYRDSNVHDSGSSVQCFFTKAIQSANKGANISENVKVISSFSLSDTELLADLQAFIERNGKPCCLNLITERDNKFLKNLEKQHSKAGEGDAHEGDGEHHEGAKEEDDEIAEIMRREEEDNKLKEDEAREQKAKDLDEA